jgi:hypothetical protein
VPDYADGGIVDGAQPRWILHNYGCPLPPGVGKFMLPRELPEVSDNDEFVQVVIQLASEPIPEGIIKEVGSLTCPIIKPDVSKLEKEKQDKEAKDNGISGNQAT